MTYIAQLLQDGSIYEKDGIYLRYYTEEQFSKYKATANLLGSINLKPNNLTEETNQLIVQTQTRVFNFTINPINSKEKTFGYIYVGENNFIKIAKPKKTKISLIIFPILILTIIAIVIFFFLNQKKEEIIDIPTEPEQILSLSEENTEIPLYVSFNLDKEETINLSNPISNTVDFKYEIYEDNNLLFSTNYIKPGNVETITMSNYISTGEHNLIFKIRCFLNETEVNGTEEPVIITMK